MDSPQIIAHYEQPVNFSLFDCRWIPCSAKFIILGSRPKGTGLIQIYEISNGKTSLIKECDKSKSLRCSNFGASSLRERHLATGDFDGRLHIWDLENLDIPVYSVNAHNDIINCMDGIGGLNFNCGAPEIVTGSRDGSVKVWDPRQKSKPVAVMEPPPGSDRRDCWTVCFGNSYNETERMVAAGYDNGDIKLYDLRTMSLKWEANIKNGVCGLEFDRRDIKMNKLVATTLESKFFVYDMRTYNDKKGFTYLSEKAHKSTIWTCKHLPQNRDIFITCGGTGSLCLWKYNYPEKRVKEDGDGNPIGVTGSLSLLQNSTLSSQPISSLDWSPDKQGLAVCTSFDQTIRLLIVTKLNRV